uniref:Uncharacterized protein n=1 Tax=Arundo donax TaxID=35708 RepID=A0A0A8ZV35_ARUDO
MPASYTSTQGKTFFSPARCQAYVVIRTESATFPLDM